MFVQQDDVFFTASVLSAMLNYNLSLFTSIDVRNIQVLRVEYLGFYSSSVWIETSAETLRIQDSPDNRVNSAVICNLAATDWIFKLRVLAFVW